jgi:hypothetical protein
MPVFDDPLSSAMPFKVMRLLDPANTLERLFF